MIRPLVIAKAVLRERDKSETRSPHWPAVRAAWLRGHDFCQACGGRSLLQVHHCQSFHEHPELELESSNFITLCALNSCHLEIGHGGDYKDVNPKVREHAAAGYAISKCKARAFTLTAKADGAFVVVHRVREIWPVARSWRLPNIPAVQATVP